MIGLQWKVGGVPLKKLFVFIVLIVVLYSAKPYWEKPVSNYIDLSFLDPVDEKVSTLFTSETANSVVQGISNTIDNIMLFFGSKTMDLDHSVDPTAKKPDLEKPTETAMSIHNIELGTTADKVKAELGEPQSHSLNEYGTEWLTYHENYQNFVMVSFDAQQKVNALYTNDDLISSTNNIVYGTSKSTVREILGQPIKELRKGLNIYTLQESDGFDVFVSGETYTYVFYDLHQNETVTAIQLISGPLEQKKSGIYASGGTELRTGFEQQLFDLTNATRVRHNLSILKWNNPVSGTARKHSVDMATNNYFNHKNLAGKSPFNRMEDDGITFRGAGENLAYGQSSSIFAHEGLMNSEGHRKNILLEDYDQLGVGVAFNEKHQPYYTENFLFK